MILCKYETDGEITGFDNVENIVDTVLTGDYIEITKAQQDAYFNDAATHGILDGVFTNTWVKVLEPSVIEDTRIKDIKRKASSAILLIADEIKQRNSIATGLILTEKLATSGVLTTEEQSTSDALKAMWTQINGIREASNIAETAGTLAEDFNP